MVVDNQFVVSNVINIIVVVGVIIVIIIIIIITLLLLMSYDCRHCSLFQVQLLFTKNVTVVDKNIIKIV